MKNILITGATGLIGTKLIAALHDKGYAVAILSRREKNIPNVKTYVWDIEKKILPQIAIDQADVIVHLAGANVGSARWTAKRKKEIIASRIDSGALLFQKIKSSSNKPQTFITASAVGYYGLETTEKIYKETDAPANDFFGQIGKNWEAVLEKTKQAGMRSVALRLATVLAREEGTLPKMSQPLKLGIGVPLGNGKQYLPWIHIDDAAAFFVKAIEDETIQGAYNVVAPTHVTNATFIKVLTKKMKRLFIPIGVPAFLLRLFLGEMANIVLKGSRVSSEKVQKTNFHFMYPTLEKALQDLI